MTNHLTWIFFFTQPTPNFAPWFSTHTLMWYLQTLKCTFWSLCTSHYSVEWNFLCLVACKELNHCQSFFSDFAINLWRLFSHWYTPNTTHVISFISSCFYFNIFFFYLLGRTVDLQQRGSFILFHLFWVLFVLFEFKGEVTSRLFHINVMLFKCIPYFSISFFMTELDLDWTFHTRKGTQVQKTHEFNFYYT